MSNCLPLRERPFSHTSRYGTHFECERCDLSRPIYMSHVPWGGHPKGRAELAADVAEMIGYHAAAIRPDLNGFAGYDTLRFAEKPIEVVVK